MHPPKFKFRYVNEITGTFALLALLLVFVGLFLTGRSQQWFSGKYAFDLLLPEAGTAGLASGNEVFLLGINVGNVRSITVEKDGRIHAHVGIRADFQPFVRQDSVAMIKKTFGVAGDSFVEISKGTGAPLPRQNPTLSCLSSDELPNLMEKLLAELRQEILPVIKKGSATMDAWTTVAANLNETQNDLRRLLQRLEHVAARVDAGQGSAGQLLTTTTFSDDLHRVLGAASGLLARAESTLAEVDATMKNLQDGTAKLPEITNGLAAEVRDLPGLVLQTQQTMRELERLVEGVQRHWLIRSYVEQTESTAPRIPPAQVREGAR